MSAESAGPIAEVIADLQACLDELPARLEHHRVFLATYLRTTVAVDAAAARGEFEDRAWVERWDVVFAGLYLDALRREIAPDAQPSRPWRLAFGADVDLPDLRHVLFGINAHVNYDLPQSLLAVIGDAEFSDPDLIARRRHDHQQIDRVLAGRVSDEENELGGRRTFQDRLLAPLNRVASRRFLREARQKVWHNTMELQSARVQGPDAYARRLAELEVLSAAKIADLQAPGQVLLRLAVAGFGVTLPPEG